MDRVAHARRGAEHSSNTSTRRDYLEHGGQQRDKAVAASLYGPGGSWTGRGGAFVGLSNQWRMVNGARQDMYGVGGKQ